MGWASVTLARGFSYSFSVRICPEGAILPAKNFQFSGTSGPVLGSDRSPHAQTLSA